MTAPSVALIEHSGRDAAALVPTTGSRTLVECEAAIEGGIKKGIAARREIGAALLEIRDRELYAREYPDFKKYLMDRWGYQKDAYRYIDAERVCRVIEGHANEVVKLTTSVARQDVARQSLPLPPTGAHVAQLVPLIDQPDDLKTAWELALELNDGKPTFLEVKDCVQQFVQGRLAKKAEAEDRKAEAAAEAAKVCQVIKASEVQTPDSGHSFPLPPTSAHAGALYPLIDDPDTLVDAWSLALELNEGKPTFLQVKDIVRRFTPGEPEEKAAARGHKEAAKAGPSGRMRAQVTPAEFAKIEEQVRNRRHPIEAIQQVLRREKFLRGLRDGLEGVDWDALLAAYETAFEGHRHSLSYDPNVKKVLGEHGRSVRTEEGVRT